MIRFLFSLILLLTVSTFSLAQKINGQWKGEFIDNSSKFGNWGGDKCEYVLELESNGGIVTGVSYTYFTNGEKKYYTICKLKGSFNKAKKYIEVTEYERIKTNVPVEVSNCFQVHKLTYFKQTGGDESLEGNWIPAPNQKANCGYGLTTLTRRSLKNTIPGFKSSSPKVSNSYSRVNVPKNNSTNAAPKKTNPIVSNPKISENSKNITAKVSPPVSNKSKTPEITLPGTTPESQKSETVNIKPQTPSIITPRGRYEKRSNDILSTIQLENDKVRVDLYDNGEIDGDSISVFLNGKLLMSNKRLTAQPLTIQLEKEELKEINELVMYADNLGTIPPNTALMVVTDGKKRYEVRITSDLTKSGTIRFIKKLED
ncbi:MAG TPA: hypothetical protein PK504_00860 [Ferruginibacter sp.]|nr:hypothetical protein [Ferruginibacter sp.]HRE62985.1 hypothetical protein [Ferruginibacter sp.]